MSEMCVSATARSALQRGIAVVLAHDAHATYDIPAMPGIAPL
jgi:streptothricin hydrolase